MCASGCVGTSTPHHPTAENVSRGTSEDRDLEKMEGMKNRQRETHTGGGEGDRGQNRKRKEREGS